jgi:CRP-like cAMP-binding protein
MNRNQALEVLAGSSLMTGLPRETSLSVLRSATEKRCSDDTVVFREGEAAVSFFLVLEGRLKLTQTGADGHEVVMRFVGPGEAAAALAVFSGAVYPVTAKAVGSTCLLAWSHDVSRGLLLDHPLLALNALELLSNRIREMQERFRELATERVAQRLARSLLRLARQTGRRTAEGVLIDQPITREELAQLTGTTLFTVSRVLTGWEARGLVISGRERVIIRDPHGLVSIAEDLPQVPPPAAGRE